MCNIFVFCCFSFFLFRRPNIPLPKDASHKKALGAQKIRPNGCIFGTFISKKPCNIGSLEAQNASWRSQNGARNRQNGSPRLPNCTLTFQNHSKSIQDEKRRSKSGQGQFYSPHVDGFWAHLGVHLGLILGQKWSQKSHVVSRSVF